jgi:hypothetical protein
LIEEENFENILVTILESMKLNTPKVLKNLSMLGEMGDFARFLHLLKINRLSQALSVIAHAFEPKQDALILKQITNCL